VCSSDLDYRDQLSLTEFVDLVAYLKSLRE